MSDSIHVPASTVQRVLAVLRWVWPAFSIGLTTVVGFGAKWIMSRTSIEDVAPLIADVRTKAAEAQSTAFHGCSLATEQASQLEQMRLMLLDVWATAEVDRAYSKSPRRSEYIESARRFYQRTYHEALRTNQPAAALELTHSAEWRPDR